MNKIKLLIIPILLLLLCGCDIEAKSTVDYMQDYGLYEFVVDEYTCVEYIRTIDESITPRYNADGTLKLNERCIEGYK